MKNIIFSLLLLFSLSRADAAERIQWPDIQHPEKVQFNSIGDDAKFNGIPMRIYHAQFPFSRKDAILHYIKELQKLRPDQKVVKVDNPDGTIALTLAVEGFFINFIFSEQTSDRSAGILSISALEALRDWEPKPFDVAFPDGTMVVADIETNDKGMKGRVLRYKNERTVSANKQNLITGLAKKGILFDPGATIKRKSTEILFFFGEQRDAMATLVHQNGTTSVELVTTDHKM